MKYKVYVIDSKGYYAGTSLVAAESAEEASKSADLIMRKTNVVQFNNNDVVCVELEISPTEETDYADNDVHISEIEMSKK